MKYRNKSGWKRIAASPVTLVALVVLLAVISKVAWDMIQKSRNSAERLARAEAAFNDLKSREGALRDQVAYLSTGEGVEAELRSKFQAAAEGESVAVIVGESSPGTVQGTTVTTPKSPWWRQLLRFVGF